MARQKKPEEEEKLERWLVSYADYVTLLFAFFTVMYALSISDKNKYKDALENIQRAFMSAGGIFPLRGSPFSPFEKPVDRGSTTPPSSDDNQGRFSKGEEKGMEKVQTQLKGLYRRTTGLELESGSAEVLKTEQGYKIRLGEAVLFKKGSALLKKESIAFLYELGKRLGEGNYPIQIEGHTDSEKGITEEENMRLSIDRAFNVSEFFITGTGLDRKKISIAGFGDTKPISSNDTEEGKSRNRRVEISVLTKDEKFEQLLW